MPVDSFKISVVTATLNRREFLPRCLESVAGQPYPHKEHVIVDGGSTDGTVELLREYAARHPHIRWISERDNGLSDAFNKGLRLATGDVIGVLGDDDFYEPDIFGLVAETFARNPDAGLVVGGCDHFRDDGTISLRQRASFTNRRDLIQCWKHWGRAVTIPAPSTFIRKQVIAAVGGFEQEDRYAMDYHHWIKITEKFPVVTLDRTLARFHSDAGTISFSRNARQWRETMRISRQYWGPVTGPGYWRMLLSYLPYAVVYQLKAWARPLKRRLARR